MSDEQTSRAAPIVYQGCAGCRKAMQVGQGTNHPVPDEPDQSATSVHLHEQEQAMIIRIDAPRGDQHQTSIGAHDELIIGALPSCDIVVDDEYVSSRHARIRQSDGQLIVEDLGSANGTFLRVAGQSHLLRRGDTLIVGCTRIHVEE